MSDGIHDRLGRTRPPRVHLKYKVWVGDAEKELELPFVVGVVGDFSLNPTQPLRPLRERRFIEINRDNFDEIMKRMAPGVNMRVENTLEGDGSEIGVQLKFSSMKDFEPAAIVDQVPALKKLQEARDQLKALLSRVDRSPDLEEIVEKYLKNPDDIKKLSAELGLDKPAEPNDKGSNP